MGDGFGDTSFNLAYHAMKTAGIYHKPMMILAKEKRESKHQNYASSFLQLVDKDLIKSYKKPTDLISLVEDFLNKSFQTDFLIF